MLLAAFLSVLPNVVLAEDLPARNDYAYGFDLVTQGDFEFFSVDVPIAVYQSVSDPDLRDAGVYNASGQPVPRVFEHPTDNDVDVEHQLALELVPLFGEQAELPDQLRILFHQDADGTRLEVGSGKPSGEQQSGAPVTAYIVDARDLDFTLEALVFTWPRQQKGMIGRVRVEDSDDLQHWRNLGSATLAELQLETSSIEHNRVELTKKPRDYLRISWRHLPDTWKLEKVTGIYSERGAVNRNWLTLDSVADPDAEREYLFDANGYPPTDRINVLLPDENVVVRASIYYRQGQEDGWRLAHSGIFYNINRQGSNLQSLAETVGVQRANQWRVRIDSGMTTGPIQIQLGWRPDRLVFLAQGTPPFELVAGRAKDRIERYPQQSLLGDSAIFGMLRETGQQGVATLGTRVVIAGQQRLKIREGSVWKTILLWGGLSAAVLLVGWLVFSLNREMKTD
jgi:hypothetical protein